MDQPKIGARAGTRGTNAFGISVPDPSEIANSPAARQLVRAVLLRLADAIVLPARPRVLDEMLELSARYAGKLADLENAMRLAARSTGISERTPPLLRLRAGKILDQIRSFVVGSELLDYGCGDGLVGVGLSQSTRVTLADVLDYRDDSAKHLSFVRLDQGKPVPLPDKSVDTVLLLTVLHHTNDPAAVVRDAMRLSRRRIIVIESVYGIHASEAQFDPDRLEQNTELQNEEQEFAALSDEQQLAFCSFIDWFYNRVMHEGVSCPYNYNTPVGWQREFADAGASQQNLFHLGMDQISVAEFHTLHIVDVQQ